MDSFVNDLFEKREEEQKKEKQKYHQMLIEAQREIDLADHLFNITYKAINDLKMLTAIEEHIITATFLALESLLEHLRQSRKIEAFARNRDVMADVFERKIVGNYGFELSDIHFITRVLDISRYLKESTLQFKRGDSYILALSDHSIKSLNNEIVNNHLSVSKDFVSRVEKELNNEDE